MIVRAHRARRHHWPPALVVDPDVLERNIERMAEASRAQGFALRPHAKAHKCARIGELQLQAGARGLSVATIGEAEAFARVGVDDLFIAYPVWLDAGKAQRLRRLADRAPWARPHGCSRISGSTSLWSAAARRRRQGSGSRAR